MKLIDLDKAISICDEDNNSVIFANIKNAEVKAIPVEWIMWDWRRNQPDDTQEDVWMRLGVLKMLRDWEKENERETNRH